MNNILFIVLIQSLGMLIMFIFGWVMRGAAEDYRATRERESYSRFIGGHWYVKDD